MAFFSWTVLVLSFPLLCCFGGFIGKSEESGVTSQEYVAGTEDNVGIRRPAGRHRAGTGQAQASGHRASQHHDFAWIQASLGSCSGSRSSCSPLSWTSWGASQYIPA